MKLLLSYIPTFINIHRTLESIFFFTIGVLHDGRFGDELSADFCEHDLN